MKSIPYAQEISRGSLVLVVQGYSEKGNVNTAAGFDHKHLPFTLENHFAYSSHHQA